MTPKTETARNILSPFAAMPLLSVLIAAVCALTVAVIVLIFSERYRYINRNATKDLRRLLLSEKLLEGDGRYDISLVSLTSKKDVDSAKRQVKRYGIASAISCLAAASAAISVLVLASLWTTWTDAASHGYADGPSTALSALWTGTDASFQEDGLPPDLANCIIFYYKFGCPDCELLGSELYDILSDIAPTYRIATRSRTGEAMTALFPVASVPSCVYFNSDGVPLYYTLYDDHGDEPSTISDSAISSLAMAVATDRMLNQKEV